MNAWMVILKRQGAIKEEEILKSGGIMYYKVGLSIQHQGSIHSFIFAGMLSVSAKSGRYVVSNSMVLHVSLGFLLTGIAATTCR